MNGAVIQAGRPSFWSGQIQSAQIGEALGSGELGLC
jgi:hypothetical protein